jgi:UDP-2,3-diacylglucosamine pyrophosphatase LpxH
MIDGYVDFLKHCKRKWKCNRVVHIGDLVDNCALSFHLKRPSQKDPINEYHQAMEQVNEITKAFPNVDLMLGNHDVLPYRWAKEVGIPESMMRDFKSIFNLPKNWTVHERYAQLRIDNVIYQHGDRGRASAILCARQEFASVVQGHFHSKAEVNFYANATDRIFGMQVGCGMDWKHAQMEYAVKFSAKPIIGCGIVLEGTTPIFEPMIL